MRAVRQDGAGLGDIAPELVWVMAFTIGAVAVAIWSIATRVRE